MALTLDGTNGISSSGAISSSSNITATGSITTQSATGIVFSDSSNQVAAASPFSLKNRIINGDMVVNQRNPGTVTLDTNSRYFVDRFLAEEDSDATVTAVQSTTAPSGFTNSLLFTVTTADSSIGATQNCNLRHWIEGYNVADLGWGTANAKTVTLSFWVRSSVTGTQSGSLLNSDGSRSYVFTYTISAANTWEQKSVTIAGDTSGTWLTTNGRGIGIYWNLGAGSTYLGTAGSWGSSLLLGSTGSVQLISTLNATFYITGVQLEQNTTATPFEWLPYSTELALCQRYYQRLSGQFFVPLYNENTTSGRATITYPVTMRIAPTALEQSGTASDYNLRTFSTGKNLTSVPSFDQGTTSNIFVTCPVSTGVGAAGGAGNLNGNNSNAYLGWSAEL